jgi:hypothetical protein
MGQAWGKLTKHEDLKDLSAGEMLERGAGLCPDKEAVVAGSRRVTYAWSGLAKLDT